MDSEPEMTNDRKQALIKSADASLELLEWFIKSPAVYNGNSIILRAFHHIKFYVENSKTALQSQDEKDRIIKAALSQPTPQELCDTIVERLEGNKEHPRLMPDHEIDRAEFEAKNDTLNKAIEIVKEACGE